jgi:hypothetical protein
MTSILARIQANGGDVIRQEWRFTLRRGRLTKDAITWVRARWSEVCREVWPAFDLWTERAAIMEFDGGMTRSDAEALAYAEVSGC